MMQDLSADLAALCARHNIAPPVAPIVAVDTPELPPTGIDLRGALDRFESAGAGTDARQPLSGSAVAPNESDDAG